VTREIPSRIALHEAAHAVAAIELGLVTHYVTIKPADFVNVGGAAGCLDLRTQTSDGHVMVMFPGSNADLAPWCLMLCAGPAAERKQFGDSTYGGTDILESRQLVECLDLFDVRTLHKPTEAEIDTGILRCHTRADRLVAENWKWIQRVAGELDRLTGLLASEIVALKPHTGTEQAA
jgi:hypothetical protein